MTPPTDIVISIRLTREFPAEEYLVKCLETLVYYTRNFRLLFVDDNSDDIGKQVIENLARNFPESLLVRTHKQHWFTRAFNTGLMLVRTPYAVMLNSDTIMGEGWLDELYSVKDDVIALTQGRVGLVGSVLADNEPRRLDICRQPNYVTGHCLLVDMEAMKDVAIHRGTPGRYLDELNPLMIHIRSDVEICYQMMALGWNCVSSFKSAVGHLAGRSWGHQLHRIPGRLEDVNYRY